MEQGAVRPREDEDRKNANETFGYTAAATVLIGVVYGLLMVRPGYSDINIGLQFASSQDRLDQRMGDGVTLSEARRSILAAVGFSLLWGGVGCALLWKYWEKAWKAGKGVQTPGKPLGLAFGAAPAAVALVEKALTWDLIRADADGGIRFIDTWWEIGPKTVTTLAWMKWLLAGILICLVAAMLVSSATAFIRGTLSELDEHVPNEPPPMPPTGDDRPDPEGVGICCSGGGIRAASFVLGGLAKLEEDPNDPRRKPADGKPRPTVTMRSGKLGILGRARYLASVSGGGYAAAAWRIAAGTDEDELPEDPIIGDPLEPEPIRRYPKPDAPAVDLIQHVQERRVYLANGPGGLLRSGLTFLLFMVFHFFLVLTAVFVLAWPLGRIVVSWAITGTGRDVNRMMDALNYEIGANQWLPPAAAAAVAVMAATARFFMERSRKRTAVDLAMYAALAMASSLAVLLLVLPFAVDRLIRLLPDGGGQQLAVAGVYGAILTAVWQAAKVKLASVARYLGGVLLGLGLAVFALYVMAHAGDTDELFSGWGVWAGAVAILLVAFIVFNPDRWSLHGLYRRSLAGTFAAKRTEAGLFPHTEEPPLWRYRDAEGPDPVICCAAAREDSLHTGVQALSMTFDPGCVSVHRWEGKGTKAQIKPERISYAHFDRRLPKWSHGENLRTAMGAAAISGAAVAPSLGRMNMWSTNALLAAFNARLGVWVPNPNERYADYTRSTTPRLVNMFKEITRTYDATDPNIYATDGGHWENLGLVELIRRRCSIIICLDASGDPPGTYATFKEAIKLAKLECNATVEVKDEVWDEELAISADEVAKRNYARAKIVYDDETTGDLLYVKSAITESTPLHIQRYASADAKFPNYSTADQMLSADELGYLVHLGYASMDEALNANWDLVAAAVR